MKLLELMKRASITNPVLGVLHPGKRIKLRSGRIVQLKPLNLKKALTILALITEVLERIGWQELKEKSILQIFLEALTAGQAEFVDVISLLTEEPPETILSELTPHDALSILRTALEEEFGEHFMRLSARTDGKNG